MAVNENGGDARWLTCSFGMAVWKDEGINGTFADEDDEVESFACTNPHLMDSPMREKTVASINRQSALIEVLVLHPRGRMIENRVRLQLDQSCGDCPFYIPTHGINVASRLRR